MILSDLRAAGVPAAAGLGPAPPPPGPSDGHGHAVTVGRALESGLLVSDFQVTTVTVNLLVTVSMSLTGVTD
jgi:hypothetical protein